MGLWYTIKNINDERVFSKNNSLSLQTVIPNKSIVISVVLYAVSAVYFAGVMVRLMLTLTPVVCVLSAIAFSKLLELYLKVTLSLKLKQTFSYSILNSLGRRVELEKRRLVR